MTTKPFKPFGLTDGEQFIGSATHPTAGTTVNFNITNYGQGVAPPPPSSGGGIDATAIIAGRVGIIAPEDGHLTITSQPANGHAVVLPGVTHDTIALVLTELAYDDVTPLSFNYTGDGGATSWSGTPQAGIHWAGWALNEDNYVHPIDSNSDLIWEKGPDYRPVYVTNGTPTWTIAAIAANEGVAESAVTSTMIIADPTYGSNPANALSEDAAALMWQKLHKGFTGGFHLCAERGYTYRQFGRVFYGIDDVNIPTGGSNPRWPMVLSSYGTGPLPVFDGAPQLQNGGIFQNIVIEKIATLTSPFRVRNFTNVAVDSVVIGERGGFDFTAGNGLSVTRLIGDHSYMNEPSNTTPDEFGDVYWAPSRDRPSGFHGSNAKGFYFRDHVIRQGGWDDGYNDAGKFYDAATNTFFSQLPSLFNHNYYLDETLEDIWMENVFTAESSATGIMQRSGGVQRNIFGMMNAIHLLNSGGYYKSNPPNRNYALEDNCIVHLGPVHRTTNREPRRGRGHTIQTALATLIDFMAINIWRPSDSASIAEQQATAADGKQPGDTAISIANTGSIFFEIGTLIRNWKMPPEVGGKGSDDTGIDGLNTTTLDGTNAQDWLDQRLSTTGSTWRDVGLYFTGLDPADINTELMDLMNWFRTRCGKSAIAPAAGQTHSFEPFSGACGMRWEERTNWDTGLVPGNPSSGTDNVDLRGAKVIHSHGTDTVGNITFGTWGSLHLYGGRITAATLTVASAGNAISINNLSDFIVAGYAGANNLGITITKAGRLLTTAAFTGNADISVSDFGQFILGDVGNSYTLPSANTLTLTGGNVIVGTDDTAAGTVTVTLNGTVAFVAAAGAIGTIKPAISGRKDNVAPVATMPVTLAASAVVTVDSTGLAPGTYTLIESVTDNGASLPAGVAVVAGDLVLTVS